LIESAKEGSMKKERSMLRSIFGHRNPAGRPPANVLTGVVPRRQMTILDVLGPRPQAG
jgi:hypothetical protein